jgi:putative iron-regulated protein
VKRLLALAAAAIAATAAVVACTDIPIGDGPRKTVVRRVTSQVIAPSHAALARGAEALQAAVATLVGAPEPATLAAAQQAWRDARTPWTRGLVFRVGPVQDDLFQSRLDQWPVDDARIATEIAGSAELTPVYIDGLGANKKGFHAIELLLFDESGDAAVLAAFTEDPLAARRAAYLSATAALLVRDARALDAAWNAPGDFVTEIVDIGGAGPFATVKEATDALLNESIAAAQIIADTRLGKPMGKATGTGPLPSLIESLPSDGAIDEMRASLAGIRAVYQGPGGADGLTVLVARASSTIDARVHAEIAALDAALAAIPRPFAAAVVAVDPRVETAWQAARALRLTLATEVIAALGATLSLNDNDGD